MHLEEELKEALRAREAQGLLRTIPEPFEGIDFASNDYFGFAKERALVEDLPTGSTGSRLLTGNHPLFNELETQLAAFHQAESALLFNSGYQANLGLMQAFGGLKRTLFFDKEVHASLIDGIRLSGAPARSFPHNDLKGLEKRLHSHNAPSIVVVESVYSVSGDRAPLHDLQKLCAKYEAAMAVDESHATGIFGKHGEGLVVQEGLQNHIFARMHSFGKAAGVHGACVIGSRQLIR